VQAASFIFIIGLAGVGLNFWADKQRQTFRELDGKCLVWGKAPVYVKAAYSMTNAQTGKVVKKSSLLLASGWWGIARHLQYAFELTAVRQRRSFSLLPTMTWFYSSSTHLASRCIHWCGMFIDMLCRRGRGACWPAGR
jgi:hypothetical protein